MARSLLPHGVVALRAVSAAGIRQLNRDYRAVDQATDVLSFPSSCENQHGHAGDIALCWTAVERQAQSNGNTVETEAVALVAHGLLHLAGFDHDSDKADRRMTDLTVKLCREAGIEVRDFGH